MRLQFMHPRIILTTLGLIVAGSLLAGQVTTFAQSQEPKPAPPPVVAGTPIAQGNTGNPESGINGNAWTGPNFGVSIAWDTDAWIVETEQIQRNYDGLRLGTPASSVFVEAYTGFPFDPVMCLEDANAEIAGRTLVTEVVPLQNRPLPDTGFDGETRQLFGVAATLEDGTVYRGAEYVECRALPGGAVLELTWQVPVQQFNAELPLVNDLFANLVVPGDEPALPPLPAEPPVPDPAM